LLASAGLVFDLLRESLASETSAMLVIRRKVIDIDGIDALDQPAA